MSRVRKDAYYLLGGQKFTPREKDVWRMYAENETTKGAALALGISPKTVEYHRDHLYSKLGLRGYAALTRKAIRVGLIEP